MGISYYKRLLTS